MKPRDIVFTIVIALVLLSAAYCFGIKKGNRQNKMIKPMESYLVQVVDDPNWITNYGVDLESRLVYNVALLNQIVNRQGVVLQQLLEDPNR